MEIEKLTKENDRLALKVDECVPMEVELNDVKAKLVQSQEELKDQIAMVCHVVFIYLIVVIPIIISMHSFYPVAIETGGTWNHSC